MKHAPYFLAMLLLAAVAVHANTYKLRDHDTYTSSNWKSHSSFADQNDSTKKGAGWVNADDPSDTMDFPVAGHDYVSEGFTLRTTELTSGCTFAGDTLKLLTPNFVDGQFDDKLGTDFGRLMFKNKGSSTVAIADFTLENAAVTFSDTYANLGIPVLTGQLTIANGYKGFFGTPATGDTGDRRADIRSSLVGSGTLVVYFASADTQAIFSGDMGGVFVIGGGEDAAEVAQGVNSSFADSEITVLANGKLESSNKYSEWGRCKSLTVRDGGTANILPYAGFYISSSVTLRGSIVTGKATVTEKVTSEASDTLSALDGLWSFASWHRDLSVADGTAPVDLRLRELKSYSPEYSIRKVGAGTLRTTGNCANLNWPVMVNAGTWLVDNPSAYGLGKSTATVAKGACLGGRGFIGASTVLPDGTATLTLAAGTADSYATLAPGSIDETTGEHLLGTLTVASESVTNDVSLGAFSHVRIELPKRPSGASEVAVDRLVVHGRLAIGDDAVLDLTAADPNGVRGGTYTILHADAGIAGTFASVQKPNGLGCTVRYVAGQDGVTRDIEVSVAKALVIFIL